MSRVPLVGEDARLDLVQGSTLDETWSFTDAAGHPDDLAGYTAELRIARDADSAPFLVLSTTHSPGADGLDVAGNTLRLFITAATLAGFDETDGGRFRPVGGCDGAPYEARYTLLFTAPEGVTTVEAIGPVGFTPIVEPGP